jgi:hypothetical protein
MVLGYRYFKNKNIEKKNIISNCEFTIGKVKKVYKLVGTAGRKVTYYYYVDGKYYSNTIKSDINLDSCNVKIENCINIEYWVAYLKVNPSKSMIDLSLPIRNGENPKFSRSLIHFEN